MFNVLQGKSSPLLKLPNPKDIAAVYQGDSTRAIGYLPQVKRHRCRNVSALVRVFVPVCRNEAANRETDATRHIM